MQATVTDRAERGPDPAEVEQILKAAWAVLERSGFRSLKVRQVLLASNSSASNFYRRFPSKSHLLLALLEDETRRTDIRLMAKVDKASTGAAKLEAWLAFNLHIVHDPPRVQRVRLFMDPGLMEELPEEVQELHDSIGRRLEEIIRHGVSDGTLSSRDPDADVGMIRALMGGLISHGLMGRHGPTEEADLAATYDFVMRALAPPAR